MKVRWTPKSQLLPALKGKLMVDTFRGVIRVRKWPRKRGRPKSARVRRQNDWFTGANSLAKVLEPTQMNMAIAMTKGTGLYPRDLLLRQMAGGMYDLIDETGRNIKPRKRFRETVVFQGAILELSATQNIPTGVFYTMVWSLPVLDTNGFWNVAAPTRLTIPAGVNVVALTAGWGSVDVEPAQDSRTYIGKNGGTGLGDLRSRTGRAGVTTTRGPLTVVEGDYFEMIFLQNQAGSVTAKVGSYLTINVLDAD